MSARDLHRQNPGILAHRLLTAMGTRDVVTVKTTRGEYRGRVRRGGGGGQETETRRVLADGVDHEVRAVYTLVVSGGAEVPVHLADIEEVW